MAIAETAQLAVNLTLGGNFTGGLTAAEGSLGRFNATAATSGAKTGVLSGAFTTVERGAARMGGALSHAGGQIKGLIAGPLGLIGLTGGLLSAGGAMASTLGKLNDLAFGTEKLTALTGDSAEKTSTLIAATEKYGISLDKLTVTAGFYEKTVGKLNETTAKQAAAGKSAELQNLELVKAQRVAAGESTKRIDLLIKEQKARDQLAASTASQGASLTKLQALEAQYGVVLTDATGKALSFDDALLSVADVYSKSTDKASAAILAATLFGRSYTGLIPILALGRQGILDLETEAAKMGLQLSDANVADFAKYRDAIRGSQEAISGLQVAIGTALLPTIIDAANGLKSFVTDHKADIVTFFRNAVAEARTLAGILGGFAHKAMDFWNSIPAPFRDLLVKGIVADRTIHFLFGFSPIGSAVGGIEKLIAGAVVGGVASGVAKGAIAAGLGKFFVQPVFVTNPGFGIGGGPGGLIEDAAAGVGAAGLFTVGLAAASIAAIGLAFYAAMQQHPRDDPGYHPGQVITPGRGFGPTSGHGTRTDIYGQAPTPAAVPFHDSAEGHAADTVASALIQFRADERASITATKDLTAVMRHAPWLTKLEASWRKAGQTMHDKIAEAIKGLTGPHSGAAALFLGANLGSHGFGAGGLPQAMAVLATLKAMQQTPEVVKAIKELTAKLPRLRVDAADLTKAETIAQSNDPKNKKLDALNAIMTDLKAHGDRTTQHKVGDLITAVKHQKTHVTVNVSQAVSVADVNAKSSIRQTYRSGYNYES